MTHNYVFKSVVCRFRGREFLRPEHYYFRINADSHSRKIYTSPDSRPSIFFRRRCLLILGIPAHFWCKTGIHSKYYGCGLFVLSEILQTTRAYIVVKSSTGSPLAESPVTIVIYEPRTTVPVEPTSELFISSVAEIAARLSFTDDRHTCE